MSWLPSLIKREQVTLMNAQGVCLMNAQGIDKPTVAAPISPVLSPVSALSGMVPCNALMVLLPGPRTATAPLPLGASSPFPFRQGFVLQPSPVMGSEPEKAHEAMCWALVAGGGVSSQV